MPFYKTAQIYKIVLNKTREYLFFTFIYNVFHGFYEKIVL